MMLVCFPHFGKLILLNWSLKPAATRSPVNERNDICLFLLGEFTFALWYLLMYWPTMLEVRVLKLESLISISSGFCYTCSMSFNCTAKMSVGTLYKKKKRTKKKKKKKKKKKRTKKKRSRNKGKGKRKKRGKKRVNRRDWSIKWNRRHALNSLVNHSK